MKEESKPLVSSGQLVRLAWRLSDADAEGRKTMTNENE
jgi:hypothetical protein